MSFPARYNSIAELIASESRRHEWRAARMQRLWTSGRAQLPRSLDSDLEPNVGRSSGSDRDSVPDIVAIQALLLDTV